MTASGDSHQSASGPAAGLDLDVVRHIARLSRLELTEPTLTLYARQLGAVLDHARALARLDLSAVAPMAYPGDSADVWGQDEPEPGLSTETVMRLAPQSHPPFIKVPKVLGDSSQA